MKKHPMQNRIESLLKNLREVDCPPSGCICDLLNEAADCIEAMDAAGKHLGMENASLKKTIGIVDAAVILMMDDCDDRPAN